MKPNAPATIPWHPAFVEALQLELADYADALQFLPEFQLTDEPLRIDVVIIKKIKNIPIKKNIAAIFKTHNLIEYKSPDDYISINDFYKVYGYACLYASLQKIPITDLTLSFVESRYPRNLLNHLQKTREYTVEETSAGIYTVTGDILPIQLVDSRSLSADENLWLKSLSNALDTAEAGRIVREISRQEKGARILAYLYAIERANSAVIKEASYMIPSNEEFEQVLQEVGWTAKWEARGEARGRAEGEAHGRAEGEAKSQRQILELLERGVSAEELRRRLSEAVGQKAVGQKA